MNSFIGNYHMPTSHIFVVDKGVWKKVSKLSRWYRHYKKLLSTAKPFMSSAQETADTDSATTGCAYAHTLPSDADNIIDQDDDSLLETSHSIGLKSDGGGRGICIGCW